MILHESPQRERVKPLLVIDQSHPVCTRDENNTEYSQKRIHKADLGDIGFKSKLIVILRALIDRSIPRRLSPLPSRRSGTKGHLVDLP